MENYLINDLFHPIYGIYKDTSLIGKEKGVLSYSFEVYFSSLYGKNTRDFENITHFFSSLIDQLGNNYVIHKSDFFYTQTIDKNFNGFEKETEQNFIKQSNQNHFVGRKQNIQRSFITISCLPNQYFKFDSLRVNSFLRKESKGSLFTPALDKTYISKEALQEFESKKKEITHYIENSFCQGKLLGKDDFENTLFPLWKNMGIEDEQADVVFEKGNCNVGDKTFKAYTIESLDQLPDNLPEYIYAYEKQSEGMPIPKSLLTPLTIEGKGNRVINQYFYIPDQEKVLDELKKKENRLYNFSHWMKPQNQQSEIGQSIDAERNELYVEKLKEFKKLIISNDSKIVYTHINVLAEEIRVDNNFPIKLKHNTVDTKDIYFASCPGNAVGLPIDLYMPLEKMAASCFFYAENYTQGNTAYGLRVIDIISGNPLYLDLFHTPKRKGLVTHFNTWAVGNTGSGKSFNLNTILAHEYLMGNHVFNIDGSSSFERATQFIYQQSGGKDGFFLKISPTSKIGMNPFIVPKKTEEIIKDKVVFISYLLLTILEVEDKSEYSLVMGMFREVLNLYYKSDMEERNFNSFYEFFKENVHSIIAQEGLKGLINPNQYIFILKDYYKGGVYDFLLNNRDEQLQNLKHNRYITFQIKELKDNPTLFSIVTFLLTNIYKEILYAPELLDKVKFIHYDEAWTAMDKPILVNFIKDTIKTVRSQNGATIFTSQEPEDFFESEVIKNAVLNNSDIGIVLSLNKYKGKADYVKELLSLTETQKNVVFSLNNKYPEGIKCREFAVMMNGGIQTYGCEVSLEEKAIYESDPNEKTKLKEIAKTCNNNQIIVSKEYARQQREKTY
ncbi:MAG: TraG family conjugative transposon ATPase [Flavobacteriales bacterium]